MTIFTQDGFMFLLRWLHIFFGVIWIGLLYYFNFVQGAFFAETDANTKSAAIQKLVPRALWWFRWGAMGTFLTGFVLYAMIGHLLGASFFISSRGIFISMGGVLGLVMWANVWFRIWPNQKIVIQSATQAAQPGGKALPEAAAAGAKAALASRHNTFFSIPLLFFMAAANHLPVQVNPMGNAAILWGVFFVLVGAFEFNALKGKTGPLTSIKGVVHCGFAFAIVLYVFAELLLK